MSELMRLIKKAPNGAVGFATGPQLLEFFIIRAGQPMDRNSHEVDLSTAYDVRIFSQDKEWHWWWDQRHRCGRWALLDDAQADDRGWAKLEYVKGKGWQHRLLRGSVINSAGDWSELHDGHSRPMWVPVKAEKGSSVRIGAVEYLATDDHGNVGVVAERLTVLSEVRQHG